MAQVLTLRLGIQLLQLCVQPCLHLQEQRLQTWLVQDGLALRREGPTCCLLCCRAEVKASMSLLDRPWVQHVSSCHPPIKDVQHRDADAALTCSGEAGGSSTLMASAAASVMSDQVKYLKRGSSLFVQALAGTRHVASGASGNDNPSHWAGGE